MLNKKFLKAFVFILVSACALCAQDFAEMFKERAKCAVTVKYIVEQEEYRQQYGTSGLVADENGLIVLPINEIPAFLRPSSLKDFKVYIEDGDEDGYAAEYLGMDNSRGAHFIKLKEKMPDLMTPYTKFPKGVAALGQDVWGVGIALFNMSYEAYLLRSYVSDIGMRPRRSAGLGNSVSTIGGPVFNNAGEFVGWGQSERSQRYTIDLGKNGKGPVTLIWQTTTSDMLFPEELERILASIPADPSGDPIGWFGVASIDVLKRDVAKLMGLEKKTAFILGDVIKGTCADKAGLQKGDIIVGVDGKEIERLKSERESFLNFLLNMSRTKPGDKIAFTVVRGTEEPKEYNVVLDAEPKTYKKSEFKYFKRLGFSVREYLVDDAIARRKLDGVDVDGAIVQFVKPNSPASSALPTPLNRNDAIKEINSVPVKTYAEAIDMLSKIEDDSAAKELVILAEDVNETKVVRIKLD